MCWCPLIVEAGFQLRAGRAVLGAAPLARHLSVCLGFLAVLAGPAAAQLGHNRMRPPVDQNMTGASLDAVAKQLASDDPEKRLDAVRELAHAKGSKAVEYLVKAVDDPDERVQAKAIQILGDQRAAAGTPALLQCLNRPAAPPRMKQLVCASLGKIGDLRAVPPLLDHAEHEPDPQTRGTAIFALGEIGDPEAVDVLDRIARTDEDPTVRRVASEATGRIEARRAVGDRAGQDPSTSFLAPVDTPPAPRRGRQH